MLFNDDGKIILYDGAIGTMLQKKGLKPGDMPDLMNISSPGIVEEVLRLYIEAGSDIICTNTFGANAFALRNTGFTPDEIISSGVKIARQAISNASIDDSKRKNIKIAGDIGPIGQLLEPFGDMELDEAITIFKEQATAFEKAGADFIALETMGDLNEMGAAIKAVKENTNLPILATMTFDKTGRTFMGVDVKSFIDLAEESGVTAIGMNCSLEPKEMFPVAKEFARIANLPLIFKLNAGLPDGTTGSYTVGPEEYAQQLLPYVELGMKIAGGCCGTSPEYIAELRRLFRI